MDTSTLSFTDQPLDYADRTSTLHLESAQPPPQWFTKLISPLTSHRAVVQPPESTPQALVPQADPLPELPAVEPSQELASVVLEKVIMWEEHEEAVVLARPIAWDPSPNPPSNSGRQNGMSAVLLVFIPVLVVVLTVLVGLVCFLAAVLFMRRRRGISLIEDGGPLDLSKSDGVMGEGGTEGVELRWLETVEPDVREGYTRAKDWQEQYTPASLNTDITLTQFLSIQEKGVSAWAFEPDYEDNLSLYVQSRTEITFLSDGPGMPAREGGGNSVMANLPLPKLNEVYYWEVKMYERPPTTEVAIGLATKPYPSFRLPGWNRFSVAYFASDGFKSHNYPFTAASHGQPLAEGDVLGVGYRPRTGTVFFTRNGRKLDDAYTGLQRYNLFPTIGANGPCTVHVNLGQAGFVFIEANVKKWGLAPMVGTLAPPPAYGSERGSILLDAGYGTPNAGGGVAGMNALLEAARARRHSDNSAESISSHGSTAGPQTPPRNSSRRRRTAGRVQPLPGSLPVISSPLRESGTAGPGPTTAGSRRRALGRGGLVESSYVSPTDTPVEGPRGPAPDALESLVSEDESENGSMYVRSESGSSTMEPNPPTPNLLDISMHSLHRPPGEYFESHYHDDDEGEVEEGSGSGSGESDETARPEQGRANRPSPPPPGYAPLDPNVYSNGLPADLPEDLVNQAIAAISDPAPTQPTEERPAPTQSASGRFGWIFGQG